MDFSELVRREGFPAGVRVTREAHPQGERFTASSGERGFSLIVCAAAQRRYGAGPTLALALGRLRAAAEAGLPPRGADGTFPSEVLTGD